MSLLFGMKLAAGVLAAYGLCSARAQEQTPADLSRHRYVLGSIGSGKTMWLIHKLVESLSEGICSIWVSTHGANQVYRYLPEGVDVRYIHPYRRLGINLLRQHKHTLAERSLIAAQAITVFKRLFPTAMGEAMVELCHAACLELLERAQRTKEEVTLWDLYCLLREQAPSESANPIVVDILDRREKRTQGAMLRRLSRPLANELLQRCLSAKGENALDLSTLIDPPGYPILYLFDVDKGTIGKENADLLCHIITSHLEVVLNARHGHERQVHLYYDEFQTYAHEGLSETVEEARKRNYCLTLAHQSRGQLPRRLAEAAELCASQYFFTLRPQDSVYAAKTVNRKEFPKETFISLPPRWIVSRELRNGRFTVSKQRTPTMHPLRGGIPDTFVAKSDVETLTLPRMDGRSQR